MENSAGVIYILTNPSFPDYVKIGYADDINNRLQALNRSECIPFAFRVYATYEVPKRLTDLSLHNLIDKLNPTLRAIDTFNGKPRKKEFYFMTKEDAYSLLEAIAEIHDRTDKLMRFNATDDELTDNRIANEVTEARKDRAVPFSFELCQIPIGSTLTFWRTATQPTEFKCTVVSNKQVKFDGDIYSLSALATKLLGVKYSVHGPCYFKYNNEWLNDIRNRIGF